jgi:branched-chain amino acid transport system permease protein
VTDVVTDEQASSDTGPSISVTGGESHGWRAAMGHLAGAAVLLIILALVPHLPFTRGDVFFWSEILISIMFASAANLLVGYTGLVSFGQAAFLGVGAYTVGMMVSKGDFESMPVNLGLGVMAGALLALAVGALIVRTTGLAFAVLTLAFLELFGTMAFSEDVFGGENGLSGISRGSIGPLDLNPMDNYYYFLLVLLVLVMAGMWLLVSSPFGLILRSIRDDAERVTFLGIPVRLYKLGVFTVAGAISGLAGSLNTYLNLFVSAEVFGLERSAEPVLMAILGGANYFLGPAVGAIAYEWLREWLQDLTAAWVLWVGLGLVIIIVALRRGIVGLVVQLWELVSRSPRAGEEGR